MLMKPVYSPDPTAAVHKQVNLVYPCLLLSLSYCVMYTDYQLSLLM